MRRPHRLCDQPKQGQSCPPITGEAEFTKLVHGASAFGGDQHVDLAGKELTDYRGTCSPPAPLLDCGGKPSAIYYHVTRSNDRYYIDYWWFLRFNDFEITAHDGACNSAALIGKGVCDQHEGDWEGVTEVTPPDTTDALDYVVYAAHKGTFRYSASKLERDRGRPKVFIARGSHAAYPERCEKRDCSQPAALAAEGLVKLPEGRFDGGAPWERNGDECQDDVPTSCLLSLPRSDEDPHSWTVWAGQWGAGCEKPCGGRRVLNSALTGRATALSDSVVLAAGSRRHATAGRSRAATGSGRWSRWSPATRRCSGRRSRPASSETPTT